MQITDAVGILQGSAVTGVRKFAKKGIPPGTPMDALKLSDFDIAIASRQLFTKAKELGIPTRGKMTRTEPRYPDTNLKKLGFDSLPDVLRAKVYQHGHIREINFVITDTVETAFSRGPSIVIPGQ